MSSRRIADSSLDNYANHGNNQALIYAPKSLVFREHYKSINCVGSLDMDVMTITGAGSLFNVITTPTVPQGWVPGPFNGTTYLLQAVKP